MDMAGLGLCRTELLGEVRVRTAGQLAAAGNRAGNRAGYRAENNVAADVAGDNAVVELDTEFVGAHIHIQLVEKEPHNQAGLSATLSHIHRNHAYGKGSKGRIERSKYFRAEIIDIQFTEHKHTRLWYQFKHLYGFTCGGCWLGNCCWDG